MDIFEVISKRYSYRGAFMDQPVPREDLIKIVQAGIDAPSACNAQSTSFVIVDDAENLSAIVKAFGNKRPYYETAKAMIACVCDRKPAYDDLSFYVEDCAAATQNMLLAITALGYASVWLDGVIRGRIAAEIGRILGVPPIMQVRVLLPIGIPEDRSGRPNQKSPFEYRARFAKE
ncbi:MAG: nitroreductase family protein [Planctomycetaceae bacterium]|jgi:nitroreductase|nr:nitroreductase family protein [Planctomycetaceae bacterium]